MSNVLSLPVRRAAVAYELRFAGLFNPGQGYAFPCDAQGHVDIDSLAPVARLNYFYARAVVGREVSTPVTQLADPR